MDNQQSLITTDTTIHTDHKQPQVPGAFPNNSGTTPSGISPVTDPRTLPLSRDDEGFEIVEQGDVPKDQVIDSDYYGVVRSNTLERADRDIMTKTETPQLNPNQLEHLDALAGPVSQLPIGPKGYSERSLSATERPAEASTSTLAGPEVPAPQLATAKVVETESKRGDSVGRPFVTIQHEKVATTEAAAATALHTGASPPPIEPLSVEPLLVPDRSESLLQRELSRTKEQVARLRLDLGQARSLIATLSAARDDFVRERVKMVRENEALAGRLVRAEKSAEAAEDLTIERDEYARELGVMREGFSEDTLRQRVEELEQENGKLVSQVRDLEYRLSNATEVLAHQETGTEEATARTTAYHTGDDNPQAIIDSLSERIQKLDNERSGLFKIVQEQDHELDSIRTEISEAVRKYDELAAVIGGPVDTLGRKRGDLGKVERKEDQLVKDFADLAERAQAEERAAARKIDQLTIRLDAFASKTAAIDGMRSRACRNLTVSNNWFESRKLYPSEISRLEREIEALQREVSSKTRAQRSLHEELMDRDRTLVQAERENAEQGRRRQTLVLRIEELIYERDGLARHLEEKTDEALYLRRLVEDQRAETERFLVDVTKKSSETQRGLNRLTTFISALPSNYPPPPPRPAPRGLIMAASSTVADFPQEDRGSRDRESEMKPSASIDLPRMAYRPRSPFHERDINRSPKSEGRHQSKREAPVQVETSRRYPTSHTFDVAPAPVGGSGEDGEKDYRYRSPRGSEYGRKGMEQRESREKDREESRMKGDRELGRWEPLIKHDMGRQKEVPLGRGREVRNWEDRPMKDRYYKLQESPRYKDASEDQERDLYSSSEHNNRGIRRSNKVNAKGQADALRQAGPQTVKEEGLAFDEFGIEQEMKSNPVM
ncbi:hypothetical protein HDU93_003991 [Gonapodya sp. JEL0774]|nr:hypothetical protein HDU93_003991 [Gonapodya sp. JEL0774]